MQVCEGMVLMPDKDGRPQMASEDAWNGRGCWGCQHCMAVCPNGAISIMGRHPENSVPPPGPEIEKALDALILNRRSCRIYEDRNVEPEKIQKILKILSNAPSGGNRQAIEFTVVTDKDKLKEIWNVAYTRMECLAAQGIYSYGITPEFYEFMKASEQRTRPGDSLFCTAPHLFIAHQELRGDTSWATDKLVENSIVSTYFELLCAAHGLAATMMTYPVGILREMPDVYEMLGIPSNHCVCLMVGFGYPKIKYPRGVQREGTNVITLIDKDGMQSSGRVGGWYAPDERLDDTIPESCLRESRDVILE